MLQDEYLDDGGEGGVTLAKLVRNLEDTLRQSGKNLFVCSPRDQELGTMQATLELVLWSRERGCGLFLVWKNEVPHGVVVLPWMRAELYARYLPWKERNVERSVSGQFRDNTYLIKQAMRVFDDPRFVAYMVKATNKPMKADFEAALEFFMPQMMTGTQAGKVVRFMAEATQNWERLKDDFEAWFGVTPSPGLVEIAKKCHKE